MTAEPERPVDGIEPGPDDLTVSSVSGERFPDPRLDRDDSSDEPDPEVVEEHRRWADRDRVDQEPPRSSEDD